MVARLRLDDSSLTELVRSGADPLTTSVAPTTLKRQAEACAIDARALSVEVGAAGIFDISSSLARAAHQAAHVPPGPQARGGAL